VDIGLEDSNRLRERLEREDFDVLVNCAALTQVDHCETHRDEADQVNAVAPRVMAEVCSRRGADLIHVSTDYVFDGCKGGAYDETDEALPISEYGRSKLRGEREVLGVSDRFRVVRVSWVFGPDRPSFVDQILKRAATELEVSAVDDKWSSPAYTKDLAEWMGLMMSGAVAEGGIYHLANSGTCTWREYGQHALDVFSAGGGVLKTDKVLPIRMSDIAAFVARRPVHSTLSCGRFERLAGIQMRAWQEAVAEYVSGMPLRLV
jgi:dTDP-4-dehydrorhamnose reductase